MYYLIALIVPPLVLLIGRKWLAVGRGTMVLAMISMMGMYAVTVGAAQLHSGLLEHQLNQFDKDKDGVFSPSEQTPEQRIAMERLVNDAGRNLTVFLAVPWAVSVSTLVFLLAFFARRRLTSRSSRPPSASAEL